MQPPIMLPIVTGIKFRTMKFCQFSVASASAGMPEVATNAFTPFAKIPAGI